MGKKVYLDCGANLGQGFDRFFPFWGLSYDTTEIHLFEPNKNCIGILKEKYTHPNINIHHAAVWNKNEKRTLNIEYCPWEGKFTGGATNVLHENFIKPEYVFNGHMQQWPPLNEDMVDCIDFSEFVKTRYNVNDDIHLKIDIEGAECEVFDKMIEDDTLKYIKHIIIEWHFHMRKNSQHTIEYYEDIIKKLSIDFRIGF